MQCEVRKSCNLRNVVYEIGKLGTPVGIILLDATGAQAAEQSVDFAKSPRDEFWDELKTVFRAVGQAHEYTLEEDIKCHLESMPNGSPIVVETKSVMEPAAVVEFSLQGYGLLAGRMRDAGVKRVALVCLAQGDANVRSMKQTLVDLTPRSSSSEKLGVDMVVIADARDY